MSSVLKPAYLHAADPARTGTSERYLYADPTLITQACDASSAFLRTRLTQPRLNIRPLSDGVLQDWNNLPDNNDYFMWRHLLSLHPDSGNFGFAVYHDDLLCGMALNSFVERPLAGA